MATALPVIANQRVLVGAWVQDEGIRRRLVVCGAEPGENFPRFRVRIAPAAAGDLGAGVDAGAERRLAFFVGEMRLEAFVRGVDLGPLAHACGRVVGVVADHARMVVVHHLAKFFLVRLEVGLAAFLQVPLDLEHEGHESLSLVSRVETSGSRPSMYYAADRQSNARVRRPMEPGNITGNPLGNSTSGDRQAPKTSTGPV
jgi:hypothetical protein